LLLFQDTEQQLELQASCAAALYHRGGAYAEAAGRRCHLNAAHFPSFCLPSCDLTILD
jgi:hypothetical protein